METSVDQSRVTVEVAAVEPRNLWNLLLHHMEQKRELFYFGNVAREEMLRVRATHPAPLFLEGELGALKAFFNQSIEEVLRKKVVEDTNSVYHTEYISLVEEGAVPVVDSDTVVPINFVSVEVSNNSARGDVGEVEDRRSSEVSSKV